MKASFVIVSPDAPKGCHAIPFGSCFNAELSVDIPNCEKAYFYLGNDDSVILSEEIAPLQYEGGFLCVASVKTVDIAPSGDGLFFCHFEFVSDGKRYFTAFENGNCTLSEHFVNEEQVLVYDDKYDAPAVTQSGTVYQIFPDRFSRGGEIKRHADAVYNDDWENGIPEYPLKAGEAFPNNTHFGGSLWGVIDRLPYIASLGISCIYLNPIFKAFSNHKYDTGDFMSVDETFGGDEALKKLVSAAHNAGIKVILDGVFNHVGDDSIYFNRYGKYQSVGACQSKASPYYEWFSFESYPDVYDCWWGITNLPRTVRCESYIRFITEKVIPKYSSMGIDGWRLDVADELEDAFLNRIVAAIKKSNPHSIIIGEVWEDASCKIAYGVRRSYLRGGQLDSVTNYPLRNAIIALIRDGDTELFISTINALYSHYPPQKLARTLNFLGSHDTERIITVLGGEPDDGYENARLAYMRMNKEERAKAVRMLENAYLLLASLPGIPCIYYGDEIGMEGYHDPFNRRPFPVSGGDNELFSFFARVNNLRSREKLFLSEELSITEIKPKIVKLVRGSGTRKLIIYANMSDNDYLTEERQKTVDIFSDADYNKSVCIKAKSVKVLKTE